MNRVAPLTTFPGFIPQNSMSQIVDKANKTQPLTDGDKYQEFSWNEKSEFPLFRWIFNRFFSDLLLEYDINPWSLNFKEKAMNDRYSRFLAKRTMAKWNLMLLIAWLGGIGVIVSDFYYNTSVGSGYKMMATVVSFRVFGLIIMTIPLVISRLKVKKLTDRTIGSNLFLSLVYLIGILSFFVLATIFSFLANGKLNLAAFCLVFEVSLLLTYTFLNQSPIMAFLSGIGSFTLVFISLVIITVVSKSQTFPVVTVVGVVFTNLFLLIAYYQASLRAMVIYMQLVRKRSSDKLDDSKLIDFYDGREVQGIVTPFTAEEEGEYAIFRNKTINSSYEPIVVLLLIYDFIRMPFTMLFLHPQLMLNVAAFYFIPLSLVSSLVYVILTGVLQNPRGYFGAFLVTANLILHSILYSLAFHLNHGRLGTFAKDLGILSPNLFMLCVTATSGLPVWFGNAYASFSALLAIINASLYVYYSEGGDLETAAWITGILIQCFLVILYNYREEIQMKRFYQLYSG